MRVAEIVLVFIPKSHVKLAVLGWRGCQSLLPAWPFSLNMQLPFMSQVGYFNSACCVHLPTSRKEQEEGEGHTSSVVGRLCRPQTPENPGRISFLGLS